MNKGLSSAQAAALLKQHGYNELPSSKPKSIWRIALEVMKEPMFILLISCGALYMLLGDYSEGLLLLCWVFVIIFITFFQHQKTEKSLEALRMLSSPRAMVLRDGEAVNIAGRDVVPGDIMYLDEGDRVPADAVVLESNHLTVDESLLTGESLPIVKTIATGTHPADLLFSGTLVVQGKGIAAVTHTGVHTQFGKIGTSLGNITTSTTHLQREMKVLIRTLFMIGACISVGVVAAFYFSRGNFLQSLLNGLAAAMSILPEEFPVVLTIFLALGAWRLSKNNVLTRNPSAIETLGSATVLCSDKTGTITQNKMQVAVLYCNETIYTPSTFQANKQELSALLNGLYYASQPNSIDPMEKAIHHECEQAGIGVAEQTMLKEYPLSKTLFAMTRVIQHHHDNTVVAYCKGAPEAIFKLCRLSSASTATYHEAVQQQAAKGYRMLAVAQCHWKGNELPQSQSDFHFSFTGLVGFEDPIRPEVPQAIKECNEAGIKVMMITGD